MKYPKLILSKGCVSGMLLLAFVLLFGASNIAFSQQCYTSVEAEKQFKIYDYCFQTVDRGGCNPFPPSILTVTGIAVYPPCHLIGSNFATSGGMLEAYLGGYSDEGAYYFVFNTYVRPLPMPTYYYPPGTWIPSSPMLYYPLYDTAGIVFMVYNESTSTQTNVYQTIYLRTEFTWY
jgi:hypothetical protein